MRGSAPRCRKPSTTPDPPSLTSKSRSTSPSAATPPRKSATARATQGSRRPAPNPNSGKRRRSCRQKSPSDNPWSILSLWCRLTNDPMTAPLTFRQSYALGQQQRKHMRRAGQASWKPKLRRADPLRLVADSMRGRVPALVQIKYDRMAGSPFGFFRGAVPVMACDLSLGPNTGIHTQLCGDAHVRNLGAFAALDGRLVFDINDFDETIRGPFEWDVKRMAASLILAGREAGAKHGQCRDATAAFLASYRTQMHFFARMPVLQLARFMVHRLQTVDLPDVDK